MSTDRPPTYVEHDGTLRVSGFSKPVMLAKCAQEMLERGVPVIEFFYIGGNAGQQAMKAMTILAYQIAQNSQNKNRAVFEPLRVLTTTADNGHPKEKDASVWKLTLLTSA